VQIFRYALSQNHRFKKYESVIAKDPYFAKWYERYFLNNKFLMAQKMIYNYDNRYKVEYKDNYSILKEE
jgi:hypothetical protein